MLSEEVPEKVSKNIIDYDQHSRDKEVHESLVNIKAHEPWGTGADKKSNDDPSKQSELIF